MNWMRFGGLVSFCYGRYTNPYGYNKTRDGGHCCTLNEVWQYQHPLENFGIPWLPSSYYTYRIGYRDPAQDEGDVPGRLDMQSTYNTKVYDVHGEKANFGGTETVLYGVGDKPASNSSNYAYIDGYRVILPLMMLSNVVTSDNFVLHFSNNFATDKQVFNPKEIGTLALPYNVDSLGDFAFDPMAPAFVRTAGRTGKIYQNEFTGRTGRLLATAPSQVLSLDYGNNFDLFALQCDRISRLSRDGRWTAESMLDFTPEACTYDPVHDEVIVGGETSVETLGPDQTN